MLRVSELRWNSLFSFLSAFIQLGSNTLLFWGVARIFGAEAFGQFTLAHLLAIIFLYLSDFGIDLLFTTDLARERQHATQLFCRFASLKVIFVGGALVVMMLLIGGSDFSPGTRLLLCLFVPSVVFTAISNFVFALFRGFEQLQHQTRISFLQNVALLLSLAIMALTRAPLWLFATAYTLSRAVGVILAVRTALTLIDGRHLRLKFDEGVALLQRVWPFGIHLILAVLLFHLDTLLLSFFEDDYSVGIYQAVMKLVTLTLILPDVLIQAMLPTLARLHSENEYLWLRLGRFVNKTLLFVSLPLAFVFVNYPDTIISLVYGSTEFAAAIPLMQLAGAMIVFRFVLETYGVMLTAQGEQWRRTRAVVLATTLALAGNLYAIPRFSRQGALTIALAVSAVLMVTLMLSQREFSLGRSLESRCLAPLVAILALSLGMWHLSPRARLLLLLPALLFYLSITLAFGYSADERRMISRGQQS